MRFVVIASCALLAACSPPKLEDVELGNVDQPLSVVDANETVANAGFDKITYKPCKSLRTSGKLSPCGKDVLQVSYDQCRLRAESWAGLGSSGLDEYAGDSWQERGGLGAQSMAKRIERIERRGAADQYVDYVSVAVGNGSDAIAKFACDMDENLHLQRVSRFM